MRSTKNERKKQRRVEKQSRARTANEQRTHIHCFNIEYEANGKGKENGISAVHIEVSCLHVRPFV